MNALDNFSLNGCLQTEELVLNIEDINNGSGTMEMKNMLWNKV
jgi:hypothetical protein